TAFVTLIVACTNNQESQTRNTDKIDVEQSSYEPDNIMDRNDIADHLANLAVKTNHVNDAAAIVVGPYTVVGIDINEEAERTRTSTIAHTVLEALSQDPYGREVIVIADADMPNSLRGMREAIHNGAPIQGVADEIANILSRHMPTTPESHNQEEAIIRDEENNQ